MQFNSDLKAQVAIIGHALFVGDQVTQYVRPGIDETASTFAKWPSGAAIFTSTTPRGARQVLAIALFKQSPNSDQARVAALLQADFADNPTTRALSQQSGTSLSVVIFDSHEIPIPLIGTFAGNVYGQLYHQYHDGSTH